ncbi:hypothetical protein JW948_01795 [bacterium]|nr:hypothetical protein [bacterium]
MSGFQIDRIVVHPEARSCALTERILSNRGDIPFTVADSVKPHSLREGKRTLFLTQHSGQRVKPCPATASPYLCCQYTVIHSCMQCPMDCTYCVLQDYLESPVIELNVRTDIIFGQIEAMLADQPHRFFRFGTGELGDSLALDALTGLSGDFIDFFSGRRNALIELKTKSVQIGHLLQHDPGHTVISWSVNPESVIRAQEMHAPSLQARLDAARQCQETGYMLGFHFDPVLYFEDCVVQYRDVVRRIFGSVDSNRIAWISLGSLRFPPSLKSVIQTRFPGSRIVYEEMIRGLDGKLRYPRPMRMELYSALHHEIQKADPDVFVYFCMELPRVWERVTGRSPAGNAELDLWFARSLHERFGSELNMEQPRSDAYTPDKPPFSDRTFSA